MESAPQLDLSTVSAAFTLSGRTALVTGAGSSTGIGFAAARMLGQFGARVILTGTTDRVYDRVAELTAQGIAATGLEPGGPSTTSG